MADPASQAGEPTTPGRQAGQPRTPGPPGPPPTVAGPEDDGGGPPRHRRRWLALAALLLVLGGVAAAVVLAGGSSDDGDGGEQAAQRAGELATSWEPTSRVGPVEIDRPLPEGVEVQRQKEGGSFRLRAGERRAAFAGRLDSDGSVREVNTEARGVAHRGVKVGTDLGTALSKLPDFTQKTGDGCFWLEESAKADGRRAVTQLFFDQVTSLLFRISLARKAGDCPAGESIGGGAPPAPAPSQPEPPSGSPPPE